MTNGHESGGKRVIYIFGKKFGRCDTRGEERLVIVQVHTYLAANFCQRHEQS